MEQFPILSYNGEDHQHCVLRDEKLGPGNNLYFIHLCSHISSKMHIPALKENKVQDIQSRAMGDLIWLWAQAKKETESH